MSDVVDKKNKAKPVKDLYILSVSVNGEVRGSFKMEGFGLPDFRHSWDNFIEGFVRRLYGKENVEEAIYNTETVTPPDISNIEVGFETSVNGNTILAYYTPFLTIGVNLG